MDPKKHTYVYGGNNATVVDLAKYRKGLKSAVKKPRKKHVPKYELIVCHCGGSDFKFVMASDVEHLRNSIVCACCAQPVTDSKIIGAVFDIITGPK